MDIKEHLTKNKQSIKVITEQLQQLQKTNQELLQELLRLDGEHRLLIELSK